MNYLNNYNRHLICVWQENRFNQRLWEMKKKKKKYVCCINGQPPPTPLIHRNRVLSDGVISPSGAHLIFIAFVKHELSTLKLATHYNYYSLCLSFQYILLWRRAGGRSNKPKKKYHIHNLQTHATGIY